VFLINREGAGTYALLSIGVSALTTGFTSAMIAFDMDVDNDRRKYQPKLYGYIPEDNSARHRCLALMTLISTLHNLSRSLGCALLAATNVELLVIFVCGEMGFYFAYKVIRGDFWYWIRLDGFASLLGSFNCRLVSKVISDYR